MWGEESRLWGVNSRTLLVPLSQWSSLSPHLLDFHFFQLIILWGIYKKNWYFQLSTWEHKLRLESNSHINKLWFDRQACIFTFTIMQFHKLLVLHFSFFFFTQLNIFWATFYDPGAFPIQNLILFLSIFEGSRWISKPHKRSYEIQLLS